MKKHKIGFTISEMLIALAIVGILGVVLSPVMRKIMPDQNKVMIKRTYYTITNTVAAMLDDDTLYSPYGTAGTANETVPIYVNRLFDNKDAVTYHGKTYSGDTKFSGIFMDMIGAKGLGTEEAYLNFWRKDSTGKGSYCLYGKNTARVAQTKDGVKWMFFDDPINEAISIIKLDVNGNKAPNLYQYPLDGGARTKDFDEYFVIVYKDGKVEVNERDEWVRSVLDASSSFNME